jgi:hypothetical protein
MLEASALQRVVAATVFRAGAMEKVIRLLVVLEAPRGDA